MSKEIETYNPTEESVVVYRSADNAVQLDVQLADETEGELSKEATVKDYLTVQNEGGRQRRRQCR